MPKTEALLDRGSYQRTQDASKAYERENQADDERRGMLTLRQEDHQQAVPAGNEDDRGKQEGEGTYHGLLPEPEEPRTLREERVEEEKLSVDLFERISSRSQNVNTQTTFLPGRGRLSNCRPPRSVVHTPVHSGSRTG